jgi:hypothetical protein
MKKIIIQVHFNYYDNRDLNGTVLKVFLLFIHSNLLYLCKLYINNQLNLPDCVKFLKKEDKWTTKEGQKMTEK